MLFRGKSRGRTLHGNVIHITIVLQSRRGCFYNGRGGSHRMYFPSIAWLLFAFHHEQLVYSSAIHVYHLELQVLVRKYIAGFRNAPD